MTLLLAAADAPGINRGAIAIVVLAFLGAYVVACIAWPWTSCARCQNGKLRSPTGKAWRDCPRCAGTGRKVRLGRRLWSGYADIRERGQR